MKGRRPKPTALKLVEGNRGKRKLPEADVSAKAVELPCPDGLSPGARAAWNRVAPLLANMGVTQETDAEALRLICDSLGEYGRAEKELRRKMTFENEGMFHAKPEVGMVKNLRAMLWRMLNDFGMTPSARAKVLGVTPTESTARSAASVAKYDERRAAYDRMIAGA